MITMRVLVMDDQAKGKIKDLMEYALSHIVTKDRLLKTIEKELPPIGDDSNYVIYLDDGYRVVYSVEEQVVGLCKHISLSILNPQNKEKKYPHPEAMNLILKEFGFKHSVSSKPDDKDEVFTIWVEPEVNAVNIVEKMD